MNEHVSARIALLDNQLVDADRRPIGRIDDVELSLENGTLRVDSILIGAQALGERLGGTIGRGMAAVAARLRPRTDPPGPARIDAALIEEFEPLVRLNVPFRELREVAGLERWLARHAIERLPGAGRAD